MESCNHNYNDDITKQHIEEHGLSVIMIEATDYLPSFAYSIGLWEKYNHPEIICFGFSLKNLQILINDTANIIKQEEKIRIGQPYNLLQGCDTFFIEVNPSYLPDYFGTAIRYYKHADFKAIQLVWPDRKNKFPWQVGFEEEFIYKQPLLDRNTDFKFRESKNLGTFTTRQWLEDKKPILKVVHDTDGDWQFLTGDQLPEDIRLVALEQMTIADNTLNEVFNLDYGQYAERGFIGDDWVRGVCDEEEDEDA